MAEKTLPLNNLPPKMAAAFHGLITNAGLMAQVCRIITITIYLLFIYYLFIIGFLGQIDNQL